MAIDFMAEYLGNSSSTNFGLRFHNFVKAFKSEDGDFDLGVDYPTFDNRAMPTRRPHVSALPQLPPYEQAMRLHAAQYEYIGTIFSFLDTRVFSDRLKHIYSEPLDFTDREACLRYCQVLLCLAYGQMYAINQWTGNDGPPGFSYFKQALQFLPDIHEEGSDLFVEVLSLVGYFMQNLNRRDAAFLYVCPVIVHAVCRGTHGRGIAFSAMLSVRHCATDFLAK
jgi:proline utilization trans-activator